MAGRGLEAIPSPVASRIVTPVQVGVLASFPYDFEEIEIALRGSAVASKRRTVLTRSHPKPTMPAVYNAHGREAKLKKYVSLWVPWK